jgi:outer membrane protein
MRAVSKGIVFVLLAVALACIPAMAAEGDWLVRTRLIFIEPNDDADGALAGAEVENDVTVEVDASYFFTDNCAIEGILATAAQEVTAGGESLGSVYHAPATFLGQWHFAPEGKARPYFGLGLNYTIFYSESGQLADLDLDSGSFGLAGQFGIDFGIGEDKVFNVDLKYINIENDVSAADGTSLGTVEVNPLVIGFGFGMRF